MDDEAGENNRVKALLFPLFVPVTVFRLADGVGDGDIVEGEFCEGCLQGILVEQLLLHIAFEPCGRLLERLETSLSGDGCQKVCGIGREGRNDEICFKILHKDVNFTAKLQKIGKILS